MIAARQPRPEAVDGVVAPLGEPLRDEPHPVERSSSQYSSTGSSVTAASTDTSGISRPAEPEAAHERHAASQSISARPIATAVPLKTTARPAVSIVRSTASLAAPPGAMLLAVAVDHQQRVVDRDAEPDQHDHVL